MSEADAFRGKFIEMRRLDSRVPVTSEITPPQVIGEENYDIGFSLGQSETGEKEKQ